MGIGIKFRWLVLLCALLVLVTLPRFDRKDFFGVNRISSAGLGTLGDAEYYLNNIRYYRGEVGINLLRAPYSWRPFPAALAAPLPFSPMRSLNVINLAAMLISLIFLLRILKSFKLSPGTCFLGAILYIFSFPTFYYSTIGYIDPILIMALIMGVDFIVKRQTSSMFLLSIISTGINEKFIIIFPFWLLFDLLILKKRFFPTILTVILAGATFMAGFNVIQYLTPPSKYGWYLNWNAVTENAIRPRTWLSFLLSWGPLGAFLSFYFLKYFKASFQDKTIFVFWLGVAAGLSVWAYSFVTCYADGRYVWISYPFMVPLFCLYFEKYDKQSSRIKKPLASLLE